MQRNPPVYFDNAATSWRKPGAVLRALGDAAADAGGNPGRGGHPLAQRAGETVYHARETAAAFFDAEPENVVFTQNCTHALNLAIQGICQPGDHVIISDLEHNSVARPVAALAKRGVITYTVAETAPDEETTLLNFSRSIRRNTRAVICTLVSNVTGQLLPFRRIAALCREKGILFIADGAQACGVLPVSMRDGIRLLCTAGHKGLYGTMGTGLLISDGTVIPQPLMQGGTGSLSVLTEMPDFLPDALEAGTVNVPGIAALDAGMQWVMRQQLSHIHAWENALCSRFLAGLRRIPDCTVYRVPGAQYAPLVSFALSRETPNETGARLGKAGFCLRAGLHCAPLAHRKLGTIEAGTVRFAPSVFNTAEEVDALLHCIAG
ncbi:MAG: aminotransferase class V-fold PLP-dependent enzyme [Oscillospiraceae bacterium]|nr:aminotransferase class V-fold PLP-dependent enzyme [Oscillospiraceae bacterium]